MIVDDEQMILSLAEKILQRDEHKVFKAETAVSAIELFNNHYDALDIVILDINMDSMNGFQLLARFREQAPELPCVFSSGDNYDESDVPEDINKNIHFLQKPYRANILSELIQSILTNA